MKRDEMKKKEKILKFDLMFIFILWWEFHQNDK